MPNVEALAVVTHDTSNGDTLTGIEVGMPIPLLDRNQGGIMRAQGQAAAAEREVDRVVLGLQTRLAEVFQRHDTARTQVERYSRKGGIIDGAEQTLKLIQAGYEVEEFGVLDLLSSTQLLRGPSGIPGLTPRAVGCCAGDSRPAAPGQPR